MVEACEVARGGRFLSSVRLCQYSHLSFMPSVSRLRVPRISPETNGYKGDHVLAKSCIVEKQLVEF